MLISKQSLLPFSSQQMFDLVTDVGAYPEFLPWCERAEVHRHDAQGMRATLHVSFMGARMSFTTLNRHDPPHGLDMRLERGPFREWGATWRFRDVTGADVQGVQVLYEMRYEFASKAIALLLGPAFRHIATQMLEAFTRRAYACYQKNP